jgi:hypothetical protein
MSPSHSTVIDPHIDFVDVSQNSASPNSSVAAALRGCHQRGVGSLTFPGQLGVSLVSGVMLDRVS